MNSDKTLDLVLSEIDLVEVFQRFSYEELNISFWGGDLGNQKRLYQLHSYWLFLYLALFEPP